MLGGLLVLLASSGLAAAAAPPGAPLALTATPQGNDTVELSWEPPVDDGGSAITEYRIYRAPVDGSLTLVNATSTTTYVDELPDDPGTVVEYRVTAVNPAGESVKSNPAVAASNGGCIGINPNAVPPIGIDLADCLPSAVCNGFSLNGGSPDPGLPDPGPWVQIPPLGGASC